MCTYVSQKADIAGSAKGPKGWVDVDTANVYFDYPYHFSGPDVPHTLNIDFVNESAGANDRIAVELSPDSARQLVDKILVALAIGQGLHVEGEDPHC